MRLCFLWPALAAWAAGCAAAPGAPPPRLVNSLGLGLVFLPPGEALLGSPENEPGRDADENLRRAVFPRGFYLGETEVTQAQWRELMGATIAEQRDRANPRWPLRGVGDDYPIYYVSWEEAAEFCRRLGERENRRYRLPTEEEWEYACRAGTTTPYCSGKDEAALGLVGWYDNNSARTTHPVAAKRPNAWGLYDLHGNAWEWCANWYDGAPAGENGPFRAVRGGSWGAPAARARSANRGFDVPGHRGIGLRVLLEAPGAPE